MDWLIDRFSFRNVVKPFTPMLGVRVFLSGYEREEIDRSDSGSYKPLGIERERTVYYKVV